MTKVAVSDFVHGIADKFCRCAFSHFKGCKVLEKDGMLGFLVDPNNGCSSVVDDRVRWWSRGRWERCSPDNHVRGCRLDEANEIVHAVLLVRDIKKEWVKDVPEHGEVVVTWPTSDGLERHWHCGE